MKQLKIIFLLMFITCTRHQVQTAKVIEPRGLVLRDAPTTKGKQLALMPDKEEILVLNDDGPEETLFGSKSRWFEVEYRRKRGFAFGGFLEYNRMTSKSEQNTFNSNKTFTNSIGIEFILIPAGEFMMGCVPEDNRCSDNEKPQHKVKITKPFYLGKYEVTQAQWKNIMGSNPSRFQNCGENCPVEMLSWNDIQRFLKRLNSKEGKKYRLPTEAEWEYAARADTNTIYYEGNKMDEAYTLFWDNSEVNYPGALEIYGLKKGTHPMGQKKPNAFGLYDMSGNVREWVEDKYDKVYYKNSPTNDPKGPNSGTRRVIRGCSWASNYNIGLTRLSVRIDEEPTERNYSAGFRPVLSLSF